MVSSPCGSLPVWLVETAATLISIPSCVGLTRRDGLTHLGDTSFGYVRSEDLLSSASELLDRLSLFGVLFPLRVFPTAMRRDGMGIVDALELTPDSSSGAEHGP